MVIAIFGLNESWGFFMSTPYKTMCTNGYAIFWPSNPACLSTPYKFYIFDT